MTRLIWLIDAVNILREDLKTIAPAPQTIGVVYGLPDAYDTAARLHCDGVCQDNTELDDPDSFGFYARVFISPKLVSRSVVLVTLVHELIHASVGCVHGHDKVFEIPARKIGLIGPITSTYPKQELRARLMEISNTLGSYPKN